MPLVIPCTSLTLGSKENKLINENISVLIKKLHNDVNIT